jgi:hypothetical protein
MDTESPCRHIHVVTMTITHTSTSLGFQVVCSRSRRTSCNSVLHTSPVVTVIRYTARHASYTCTGDLLTGIHRTLQCDDRYISIYGTPASRCISCAPLQTYCNGPNGMSQPAQCSVHHRYIGCNLKFPKLN